jgi:hypothetical protein
MALKCYLPGPITLIACLQKVSPGNGMNQGRGETPDFNLGFGARFPLKHSE